MQVLIVIPVRMGSSRFPGKPLELISGKPMVQWVYEHAKESKRANHVLVATCDTEILEACKEFGADVLLTRRDHTRATERTIEAYESYVASGNKCDLVIMLQGDEPCIRGHMIDAQIDQSLALHAPVTNLIGPMTSRIDHANPNTIKAVLAKSGEILYLSREPIPGEGRFGSKSVGKQVCSISFTPQALVFFKSAEETELEREESIDMLRFLENGHGVFGIHTAARTHAVDSKSDIAIVERLLEGLDEPGL